MVSRALPDCDPVSRITAPCDRVPRGSRTTVAAIALWIVVAIGFAPAARGRLAERTLGDPVPRGSEPALVTSVIDGDTLRLEDGRVVRVLGMDTPETKNPSMDRPQALGAEATSRMHDLVADRVVHLEADVTDRDHYGRILRHVWVDGGLAAEVLLREGLANAMSIPPDVRHAERLRDAEARAKATKRGLWGLPRPTPLPIFGTSP